MTHKWERPRPFRITEGDEKPVVREFNDICEVKGLRALKYKVEPILAENITAIRYAVLPRGRGQRMCELCEDAYQPILRLPATRKVYFNNKSSRLLCRFHNPIEKVVEHYLI